MKNCNRGEGNKHVLREYVELTCAGKRAQCAGLSPGEDSRVSVQHRHRLDQTRLTRSLVRRLERLGHKVTLEHAESAA